MAKPKLNLIKVDESTILENFRRVDKAWANEPILKCDWKFFELTFTGAVAHFRHPHFLKFVPRDIIQTYKVGLGDVTWYYELFDRTHLDLTVTNACTIRFFVGRHEEGDI